MILWLAFGFSKNVMASQHIYGTVQDAAGIGLSYISVSLLYPSDSTFACFGITDSSGHFAITVAKNGSYLLQVAAMGYQTYYQPVNIPLINPALADIRLKSAPKAHQLAEINVTSQRIPVQVKGDTLEYDAGAFRTKPDAVAEDLLRKLPGVSVDRQGNVTAMGKKVSQVLVDGQKFFSDDPKMATKNLPANAIKKVQSFESKSDGSLFTGIDDGQRAQTLNFILKKGHKKGFFGRAEAGGGVSQKYEGALKAFRFRKNTQLAALGMINNINQFGFSIEDYINFSGGIGTLLRGGSNITLDGASLPIDFGQPLSGDISSAALGLNYTIEMKNNGQWSMSYIGNGIKKILASKSRIVNYLPAGNYETTGNTNSNQKNLNNNLNLHWKKIVDSSLLLEMQVYGKLSGSRGDDYGLQNNWQSGILINTLDNQSRNQSQGNAIGGTFSGIFKTHKKWSLLKFSLNMDIANQTERSGIINQTSFAGVQINKTDSLVTSETPKSIAADIKFSAVRPLKENLFIEPAIKIRADRNGNFRLQGRGIEEDYNTIDSLTAHFYRMGIQYEPSLSLKKIKKEEQWVLTLSGNMTQIKLVWPHSVHFEKRTFYYLLPSFFWQRDIKKGSRITATYNENLSLPSAVQLLPVSDYSNPLAIFKGNPLLKPEHHHTLSFNYSNFDEFNLSALFVTATGDYTTDKIGYKQTILNHLISKYETINTNSGASATINAGYGRPIPTLGLKFNISIEESWGLSENISNNVSNQCNALTHKLKLSLSNLKQNKWVLQGGLNASFSSAYYSLNKEINAQYKQLDGFTDFEYRLAKSWNFKLSTNMTYYDAESFGKATFIPLVNLDVSRYLFKHQQGSLTLHLFDLLNQNRSILRSSQNNQLIEQENKIIHRYCMLTFSYRFNRYSSSPVF